MKKLYLYLACAVACYCIPNTSFSQSPGIIIRPAGVPYSSILNPAQNGFTSKTTAGFNGGDVGAAYSELNFSIVPPIQVEPTGDLATGPSGGFTDIVKTVDNSGFYLLFDGVNLMFRLRIGSVISGSKGYSILIDTDGKMGNSGPGADPDYVAPTNTSKGNPGFEYEVVLETNFRVAIYNVNGQGNPALVTSYPLASHSQISVALSTDSNNPDYFYDFAIPVSIIGSPASFRLTATTVTSPTSALQGSRSDIYGIDDANYSDVSSAWAQVINSQPPIILADITSGGTGVSSVCTNPPTLSAPVTTGSNILVGGSWSRLDASKPGTATITLYKNNVSVGTTTVSTGGAWSVSVPTVSTGDVFFAKAQATGESMCLQSAAITAGCTSTPAAPILTCGSSKGISGTIPSGSSVLIYQMPVGSGSPIPLTTNITYPTATTFAYFVNGCSGGSGNLSNGTYMILTTNGSCNSAPVFECIANGSSSLTGLAANTISLSSTLYPFHTTINGTGAVNGQVLNLFINGIYISNLTATLTSFSFTNLTLKSGDQVRIYVNNGGNCYTASPAFTVSCYITPPTINTNINGRLIAGAGSVSGRATPLASVSLYRGTAPSGVLVGSPVMADASGNWTVNPVTLTSGENYYAVQSSGGCTSGASSSAPVLTSTTICPVISGTYTSSDNSVSGTLPSSFTGVINLFLDGSKIGTVNVTSATTWTINAPFTYNLYPGGVLSVSAQATGAAENTNCLSTATISCTSPLTPGISPASVNINTGSTVDYSISNVQSGAWYAILDNSGTSYVTSIYKTNATGFSMTTQPFNTVGTYNLQISANSLTGCPAASSAAVVNVSIPLPLTLTSFTAAYGNNGVWVKWTTENELNVSHFEVEKSLDGNQFIKAGTVLAAGNFNSKTNYQFNDQNPNAARIYYRLKTTDHDGYIKYSKSVVVIVPVISQFRVSPNPFASEIQIHVLLFQAERIEIELLDLTGKPIRQKSVAGIKGNNIVKFNHVKSIPAGTYVLQVSGSDVKLTQRVIKID